MTYGAPVDLPVSVPCRPHQGRHGLPFKSIVYELTPTLPPITTLMRGQVLESRWRRCEIQGRVLMRFAVKDKGGAVLKTGSAFRLIYRGGLL
jgi:hypothetical protein